MTVKEFCRFYRISPSVYYRLRAEHRGPLETRVRFGIRILHGARMAWEAGLLSAAGESGSPAPTPETDCGDACRPTTERAP